MTAKRVESWVVTGEFWQRVEPLIPVRTRPAGKEFVRKAGAGRPPRPARQVFEAVVYVLRPGCQWKAMPKERFGSAGSVRKRFLEWESAGVFEAIWKAGLAEYDQMEGIAWRWPSIDGAMLAQEAVGPNPTDRGKKWKQAPSASGRTSRPVVAHRDRGQRECPDQTRWRADCHRGEAQAA